MNFKSKKFNLIFLGVTSLLLSRTVFYFFDDPEGPNLLVVFGLAAIIFIPMWLIYSHLPAKGFTRLLLALVIQVAIATAIYFYL